jgi:hypothetical protein
MKLFRYLAATVLATGLLFACQRELSFEGANGVSQGTLKADASGNCLPSTVYGMYKVDSTLNNTHYIEVQVNADFTGTYDIKSDTVNGYSFRGTGTVANPGLNTVRLFGNGKPVAAGINTFIVRYGTSICAIGVTVTGPGAGGLATFTLAGAPGGCTNFAVAGTSTVGVALNATNTITISVNVTAIGNFSISSIPINGFTYSAMGSFTTTGVQTVTLNGSGTPVAAGINPVVVTAGTSTCVATVTTQPAGTPAVYTMGGSPGNCTGFTANGTYTQAVPLTAANTVTMNVNVTSIGTYAISTPLQNGMLFSATGTFTATGPQTVTLTGNGVPLMGGSFNFTATGAGSSCTFSITATGGAGNAVFGLAGTPGSCTGATTNGVYTAGNALTAANTVTVSVIVVTPGTYSITTNTQNGISFSATGSFVAAGPQTVNLMGTGTPTAAGASNYTATGGGTSCTFSVTAIGGSSAAVYSLNGAPAGCTGTTVNGTYTQGVALTAANTATLNVNVTTIGTYTITTNVVNGISFSKSGTFTTTGPQTVTLDGAGTPTASGSLNIPATGTGTGSSCTFSVTVGTGGSAAVYSLNGAPASCTGTAVNGIYTQGVALVAGNTVVLNVNVTTIGTYTISTTTNNGISFSRSGTFTATGPQTVTLNGTGTPTNSGNFAFPATGAGSTCTFNITCQPGTPPNTDYFPLTQNSFWSYDVLIGGVTEPDSLSKRCDVQSSIAGNTYRNLLYGDNNVLSDLTRYRKSGNDYYEYINVDTFTNFSFDVEQFAEILFLKENAPVNTTWDSPEFTGQFNGTPGKIKYSFLIQQVNTTLTVNGVNYTNVIKVFMKGLVDDGSGYVEDTHVESYYARGIGLIKFRFFEPSSPGNDFVTNLRYYQIQ